MRGPAKSKAHTICGALLAGVTATLLASCSMTGDPMQQFGLTPQQLAQSQATQGVTSSDMPTGQSGYFIIAEDDPHLPEQVAAVPTPQGGEVRIVPNDAPPQAANATSAPSDAEDMLRQRMAGEVPPATSQFAFATPAQTTAEQPKRGLLASLFGAEPPRPSQDVAPIGMSAQPQQAQVEQATGQQQAALEAVAASTPAETEAQPQQMDAVTQAAPREPQSQPVAATVPVETPAPAAAEQAAPSPAQMAPTQTEGPKRGLLASFFGSEPARPSQPVRQASLQQPTLASIGPASSESRRPMYSNDALPGVRQSSLFEIKRRDAGGDNDIDLYETGEYQVASAPGLARLAPNGLLRQTESVDVACLNPSLVRVLKSIESHYGKRMVVTSGYRSPPRNRAARGASNSLHMYCAAADVQVPGVDKWELAKFVRTMPGRGGVGTYCHTNSVHIDVGPERDWNWRCRRR